MLSQTVTPVKVLEQVARKIEAITDKVEQGNIAASTAILAGLVLDRMFITRLLRQDIMKESVIYQEIQEIGEAIGIQKGEANIVLRQLNRRIGEIPANVKEQIRELPVEQLESLAEALLDFETQIDLINWLNQENSLEGS